MLWLGGEEGLYCACVKSGVSSTFLGSSWVFVLSELRSKVEDHQFSLAPDALGYINNTVRGGDTELYLLEDWRMLAVAALAPGLVVVVMGQRVLLRHTIGRKRDEARRNEAML